MNGPPRLRRRAFRLIKCFFLALSPLKVVILLLIIFLLHLRREPSSLEEWLEMARVTMQAELLHGVSCVACLCLLAAACSELLPITGRLAVCGFSILLGTMCWCSLVKTAELRGLELVPARVFWPAVFCKAKRKDAGLLFGSERWNCERPFSESLLGVAGSWLWVPAGLIPPFCRALCQPWALLAQIFCQTKVTSLGQTPSHWWEWRELLVGFTLWISVSTSFFHCLRRFQRRRRVRVLAMVFKDLLITLTAFLLTAQPCLWLWSFFFAPLWRLLSSLPGLEKVDPGPAHWEEILALAVLLWLLLRNAYIVYHGRVQRHQSQARLDALVRVVLEKPPARVSVDLDFETPAACAKSSGQGDIAEEELQKLRKELLVRRRRELQREMGSAHLLPSALHLFVRRKHVLQEAMNIFFHCPVAELLAPNMSVSFEGEKGIDAGGLLRDWFDSVGLALMGQTSPFILEADGLCPQGPDDEFGPEELRGFTALGRFLATAVLRGHPLPLQLGSVACKLLTRGTLSLSDVDVLDHDFCKHRVRPLLERDGLQRLEEALGEPLTFVSAGSPSKALVVGGHQRRVYESDRREYLELLCHDRLLGGKGRSYGAFQQGFWEVLPLHLLQRENVGAVELSAMISGSCDPDPEEWRLYSSSCANNKLQQQVVEWFWDAVAKDLAAEQRCRLLRFATGSSRPPPGGFAELRPPFAVEVSPLGSEHHLPTAHTCVNKLVLHFYSSKAQLLEKLLSALVDESFGTA